ncbi:MAG: hypothetical protein HN742_39510 [Lentisphaerae bacterium]|jgi:hypothetical protein|nr:hypothetical protein [Lentisphaerota bacterium]MBT5607518.1 hypothetical protein [Lentisphaerota bacterium]MBT7848022.1 hypothetical protein [Lentisphaerota bacterium]
MHPKFTSCVVSLLVLGHGAVAAEPLKPIVDIEETAYTYELRAQNSVGFRNLLAAWS